MGVKGDKSVWEGEDRGFGLLDQTIGQLLDQRADASPDKEALVYNYPEMGIEMRLNYQQYRAQIDQLAKGLMALGIQSGENIAVWAPNVPQWVLLMMALSRIGAVTVTVNVTYRQSEIEYILKQGDITHLFMVEQVRDNSYLDSINNLVPELKDIADPVKETISNPGLPKLKRVISLSREPRPGLLLFPQIMALGAGVSQEEFEARKTQVQPHDPTVMMYTSGTTGFPKGVMLTHHNVINDFHVGLNMAGISKGTRYVTSMPFFHIAGYSAILYSILLDGTLIPLIAFDPAKQMELFMKERGSMSFCVPTMLIAMLNHPRFVAGEFDLSSLELIWSGATPVPVVVMEQVKAKMGADIGIVFGLTESSGATTFTPTADPFELKSSTVGIPMDYVSVKIVGLDDGEPVPFNQSGELLINGFVVMKGYYNMPERTADAIDSDGWLHTGDLATMDERGYIKIVGRVKDMIIRGGENLYPAEIEAFLMRHPKVAEAQVVGVPDQYMGEEVVALMRLKPGETATEEELREYCRANISRQKTPKYLKFVTEFPMTASGKIKKFELKADLIKELGLEKVTAAKPA